MYLDLLKKCNWERDTFIKDREVCVTNQQSLEKNLFNLEKVNLYFHSIIESSINENKNFIEDLVNKCLKYVFGNYEIKIVDKKHGTKTIYYFDIINTVDDISGGKEAHGGGVMSVISFLFKFIVSCKFKFYPMLILDESFSFVSVEYRQKLSQFIKELCKEFNYTIILISHEKEISKNADNIILFSKVGNETSVNVHNNCNM